MNTFLTIAPYLVLAAIGLITLFRTTNALLAAEAERMAEEQQRANARQLKRAWKAKLKADSQVRGRCDNYGMHACVFGRRQGVEL